MKQSSEQIKSIFPFSLGVEPTQDQSLKLGYFAKMLERWPFNTDIGLCRDEGSALLWWFENSHLNDINTYSYNHLFEENGVLAKAPKSQKQYMDRLHKLVLKLADNVTTMAGSIEGEYRRGPPKKPSYNSRSIVAQTQYETLRGHYRMAAAAIIDGNPVGEVRHNTDEKLVDRVQDIARRKTALPEWRRGEKSRRRSYFDDFKNFITAYRLWHEMLLENMKISDLEAHKPSPPATAPFFDFSVITDADKKDRIVRFNLPAEIRHELAIDNRYLRLIDLIYQLVPVAQNMHHQQAEGVMREQEGVPYIYHPIRVLGYYLEDVLPFEIESDNNSDYLLDAAAALLHDVAEDTTLTVAQVIAKMKLYVDHIDNSIDNDLIIKSGFPELRDRETTKKRSLKLMTSDREKKLKLKLLALSKYTVLGRGHYENALNFFPLELVKSAYKAEQIMIKNAGDKKPELVGSRTKAESHKNLMQQAGAAHFEDIDFNELAQSKITQPQTVHDDSPRAVKEPATATSAKKSSHKKSRLLEHFPDTDDVKLDAFLVRMFTLSPDSICQKIFDRTQNIESLGSFNQPGIAPMDIIKKQKTLRGTVSRLLAYSIYDHDHIKYPLHNALPRLITTTLKKYEELFTFAPSCIEDKDRLYLHRLNEWKHEFPFKPLPEHYQGAINTYHQACGAKNKKRTPGEVVNGIWRKIVGPFISRE